MALRIALWKTGALGSPDNTTVRGGGGTAKYFTRLFTPCKRGPAGGLGGGGGKGGGQGGGKGRRKREEEGEDEEDVVKH